MKCPSCGHFYDDKASDDDGPECPPCAEEEMSEDTISREQAIAALLRSQFTHDDTYAYTVAALRSLPSIAPDPIEAEYREAAVALAEARWFVCNGDGDDECRSQVPYDEAVDRFSAAKAARDAR